MHRSPLRVYNLEITTSTFSEQVDLTEDENEPRHCSSHAQLKSLQSELSATFYLNYIFNIAAILTFQDNQFQKETSLRDWQV